jgi:hypothetical protein
MGSRERKMTSGLATLVLLCTLCISARAQKTARLTGSVTLSITDTVMGELSQPIVGAHVTLLSDDRIIQATSDSNGHFDVSGLTGTFYRVDISASGFADIHRFIRDSELTQSRQTENPIDWKVVMHLGVPSCAPLDTVTYREATPGNAGTLKGVVISDHYSKAPVAGAHLVIFQNEQKVSEQDTNDMGEFSFRPTRPGAYAIFVRHPAYRELKSVLWIARQNTTHVILEPIPADKIRVCE